MKFSHICLGCKKKQLNFSLGISGNFFLYFIYGLNHFDSRSFNCGRRLILLEMKKTETKLEVTYKRDQHWVMEEAEAPSASVHLC